MIIAKTFMRKLEYSEILTPKMIIEVVHPRWWISWELIAEGDENTIDWVQQGPIIEQETGISLIVRWSLAE